MGKLKTKSSAKKRFKVTGTGKIVFASSYLSHNTSKRPTKMKRQNRGTQVMAAADAKVVKRHFMGGRV